MTARRGALATPHVLATEAGADAFRQGGSAVDAALAAAAVLSVVYPHNVTIGGDLVALVRSPDGAIRCVNATGPAPARVDPDALRERYGTRLPVRGPHVITVPGAVAGWAELARLGARRPWAELLRPAIGCAREGVPVARSLDRAVVEYTADLAADPGCAAVFLPPGPTLRQPRLAESLAAIAERGPAELYGGSVGATLADGLAALGCPLGLDDLAAYEPEVTDPISGEFAGLTVHTSPPNTQGFLLLSFLDTLSRLGSEPTPGFIARMFADGIALRDQTLADPRTGPAQASGRPYPTGDTIGIAAADTDGTAVSLIQSVYHGFGAAVLEPETGILLQDRGTAFSLDPHAAAAIAPGRRPPHTLMPVLVTRDGGLHWVNATMGGQAQPQIHLQLLRNLLAGATPQEAVAAPRWTLGAREPDDAPDQVYADDDLEPGIVAGLRSDGFAVTRVPRLEFELGHANIVAIADDGTLSVGSDPRADGSGQSTTAA
ncbi:gamma-glutamyltransferase [Actinoplanes sp. NPDC051411]|uniref:gamma-glutamyltransferase family protein n=1 Tax=Actinoplanes sp. NPDC051411 TaxID=3155522 RepID=UPI00343F7694